MLANCVRAVAKLGARPKPLMLTALFAALSAKLAGALQRPGAVYDGLGPGAAAALPPPLLLLLEGLEAV